MLGHVSTITDIDGPRRNDLQSNLKFHKHEISLFCLFSKYNLSELCKLNLRLKNTIIYVFHCKINDGENLIGFIQNLVLTDDVNQNFAIYISQCHLFFQP